MLEPQWVRAVEVVDTGDRVRTDDRARLSLRVGSTTIWVDRSNFASCPVRCSVARSASGSPTDPASAAATRAIRSRKVPRGTGRDAGR